MGCNGTEECNLVARASCSTPLGPITVLSGPTQACEPTTTAVHVNPQLQTQVILPLLYLTRSQISTIMTLFKFWGSHATELFYSNQAKLHPHGCLVTHKGQLRVIEQLWELSGTLTFRVHSVQPTAGGFPSLVSLREVSKVALSDLGLEEVGRLCAAYDQEVTLGRAQPITWEQVQRALLLLRKLHRAMSVIEEQTQTPLDDPQAQALAHTTLSGVLEPPSQEETQYMDTLRTVVSTVTCPSKDNRASSATPFRLGKGVSVLLAPAGKLPGQNEDETSTSGVSTCHEHSHSRDLMNSRHSTSRSTEERGRSHERRLRQRRQRSPSAVHGGSSSNSSSTSSSRTGSRSPDVRTPCRQHRTRGHRKPAARTHSRDRHIKPGRSRGVQRHCSKQGKRRGDKDVKKIKGKNNRKTSGVDKQRHRKKTEKAKRGKTGNTKKTYKKRATDVTRNRNRKRVRSSSSSSDRTSSSSSSSSDSRSSSRSPSHGRSPRRKRRCTRSSTRSSSTDSIRSISRGGQHRRRRSRSVSPSRSPLARRATGSSSPVHQTTSPHPIVPPLPACVRAARGGREPEQPRESAKPGPPPAVPPSELKLQLADYEVQLACALLSAGPMGLTISQLVFTHCCPVPEELSRGTTWWSFLSQRVGLVTVIQECMHIKMRAASVARVAGASVPTVTTEQLFMTVRAYELEVCWYLEVHGPQKIKDLMRFCAMPKDIPHTTLSSFLAVRLGLFDFWENGHIVTVRPTWRSALELPAILP